MKSRPAHFTTAVWNEEENETDPVALFQKTYQDACFVAIVEKNKPSAYPTAAIWRRIENELGPHVLCQEIYLMYCSFATV